ncbi:hypothetical protein AVEN_120125-1, partial [Araneus ventricosus]
RSTKLYPLAESMLPWSSIQIDDIFSVSWLQFTLSCDCGCRDLSCLEYIHTS